MEENGYTYEADGATWLRTSDFNDDKDRVIIKKMVHTHTSYQMWLIIMTNSIVTADKIS